MRIWNINKDWHIEESVWLIHTTCEYGRKFTPVGCIVVDTKNFCSKCEEVVPEEVLFLFRLVTL